jgi:DNA-binding transcriptional regulator PaaX
MQYLLRQSLTRFLFRYNTFYNQAVPHQSWNLLIYRVPSQPSTQRVYVWRKLKGWVGLRLQRSVCVLPQRHDLQQQLKKLTTEIVEAEGEADLLTVIIEDNEQNSRLIERFQQQSEGEYKEFLGCCQDFYKSLEHERHENNLTFAELDENEVELIKLRSWLPKIRKRDLFDVPGSVSAIEALKLCEQDFQQFSEQVYDPQDL